jgi:hypothetical protein
MKPVDRVAQRLDIRPCSIAELSLSFGRGVEHAVLGQAQTVDRHERLPSCHLRHRFCGQRQRIDQAARKGTTGPARMIRVSLRAMEVQILVK